jgi:hypothetical protein
VFIRNGFTDIMLQTISLQEVGARLMSVPTWARRPERRETLTAEGLRPGCQGPCEWDDLMTRHCLIRMKDDGFVSRLRFYVLLLILECTGK